MGIPNYCRGTKLRDVECQEFQRKRAGCHCQRPCGTSDSRPDFKVRDRVFAFRKAGYMLNPEISEGNLIAIATRSTQDRWPVLNYRLHSCLGLWLWGEAPERELTRRAGYSQ